MLADTNPKMRGYFNPRSREGSDFTCRLKGSCINISIRAPTRGATIIGMLLTLSSRFQSALPRGERLVSVQIVILQLKISIRAPARGATLPPFPHSRPYVISIRAPARGATYAYRMYQTDTEISIRAPARGATLYAYRLGRIILFQSALPRGERPPTGLVGSNSDSISIRAPARGATLLPGQYNQQYCISIRAPARGATPPKKLPIMGSRFQSALPRGERHRSVQVFPLSLLISIRAPARGATTYTIGVTDTYAISIRAPARGATTIGLCKEKTGIYFNPRSREGSDLRSY